MLNVLSSVLDEPVGKPYSVLFEMVVWLLPVLISTLASLSPKMVLRVIVSRSLPIFESACTPS